MEALGLSLAEAQSVCLAIEARGSRGNSHRHGPGVRQKDARVSRVSEMPLGENKGGTYWVSDNHVLQLLGL
jgi:hypothetical protein